MAAREKTASDPRALAFAVLNTLEQTGNTLDSLLESAMERTEDWSVRDRRFAHALVYGVLRWRGSIDHIISHFSRFPVERIDPAVLSILRIGVFQIVYLDRVPVSAAVNTSVEMAKPVAGLRTARFVNALLRSAASGYRRVPFPDPKKDPVHALSVLKSLPEWLVKRWLERFGFEETEALCNAVNAIPPTTVRTNTLRTTRESLSLRLGPEVESLRPTRISPDGLSFSGAKVPIAEISAFREGEFQVQDEAAQLAGLMVAPKPGETVLDACAGLGGKTGHLAQLMENRGTIVSIDRDERKLLRLRAEMERLGVGIVETLLLDIEQPDPEVVRQYAGVFDRIMLDAPCSGLGVLRRNPDARWDGGKQNLKRFQERQLRFLDRIASFLKPDGILVYAVCSAEPEENEEVVGMFLTRRPEFEPEKEGEGVGSPLLSRIEGRGSFKTHPHRDETDGFFAARLKKKL